MQGMIDKTMKVLIAHNAGIEKDRVKYEYGLNALYSSVFNLIGTLIVFSVFGYLKEVLILIAFFAVLRTFSGGYHAKTRLRCFMFFVSLAGTAMWLYQSYSFADYKELWLFGLVQCIFLVAVFSPLDTKAKRLKPAQKKKYRRKSIIIVISQSVIIVGLYILSFDGVALLGTLGIYSVVFTMLVHQFQKILRGEFYYEYKII